MMLMLFSSPLSSKELTNGECRPSFNQFGALKPWNWLPYKRNFLPRLFLLLLDFILYLPIPLFFLPESSVML